MEIDVDKLKSERHYRPYTNQLFYDRLKEKYLITVSTFLRAESNNADVISFRYISEGIELVIPINRWNSTLESDGKLRFIEVNNPNVIKEERNVLQEAIELLKEVKLEIGLEDMRLFNQ